MNNGHGIKIVEIGAGGGANFAYYPENSKVTCVEPVIEFDKSLQRSIER